MNKRLHRAVTAALISSGLLLSGCNLELTPADIASSSSGNIDNNDFGLVSAATVYDWVNDWEKNRPKHITGKLVIIQYGEAISGDPTMNYIKHDNQNVFTFSSQGFSETRNDGVSNVPSSLPTGEVMDAGLAAMGLNPRKDMVLIVAGEANSGVSSGLRGYRMWYTLAYWGVNPKNMAVMNGAATHQLHPSNHAQINDLSDIFVERPSDLPNNGTTSVKDLQVDVTSINASTGTIMNLVANDNLRGTMIVDARASNEYEPSVNEEGILLKKSKAEEKTCGANGTSQCYTAFEGHIKHAVNIPFPELFNTADATTDVNGDGIIDAKDDSLTFKNLVDLRSMYRDAGYKNGDTIYTYCRTGTRASANTFVQAAVLGYPTAMYDGSWIQWGKMANAIDKNGNVILDENNQWRTDTANYTEAMIYNINASEVQQINGLNADSDNTDAITTEDQNYKM